MNLVVFHNNQLSALTAEHESNTEYLASQLDYLMTEAMVDSYGLPEWPKSTVAANDRQRLESELERCESCLSVLEPIKTQRLQKPEEFEVAVKAFVEVCKLLLTWQGPSNQLDGLIFGCQEVAKDLLLREYLSRKATGAPQMRCLDLPAVLDSGANYIWLTQVKSSAISLLYLHLHALRLDAAFILIDIA